MRAYAGIGARNTPDDVLEKMRQVGAYLSKIGFVLRSGGAEGADRAFKDVAGELSQIFQPSDDTPLWAKVFTEHFHPAPKRLKEYPRKLMDRNALQVLGLDGNSPVEFVVCWTKDGRASGGTGQAIRIAEYFKIPVFNLKNEDALGKLREWVKENE